MGMLVCWHKLTLAEVAITVINGAHMICQINFTWLPLLYVSFLCRPLTIYFIQKFIWKWMFFLFQEHRPFSICCRRLQAEIKALLQQIRTRHQSYPPIVLPTHRKPACCVIVGWQEDKWRRGTEWRKKVGLGKRERKICLVHASATLRDSDQLFAIEPELLGQWDSS